MAKTSGGVRGNNILKYTKIENVKLSDIVNIPVKGSIKDKDGNVFYSKEGVNNLLSKLGKGWRLLTEDDLYSLTIRGRIDRASDFKALGFSQNGYVERKNDKLTLKEKNKTASFWINDTGDAVFMKIRQGSSGYVLYDSIGDDVFCQIRLVKK